MATKTISIDLEAYEKLVKSRSFPQESFSKVIKRGRWPEPSNRCGAIIRRLSRLGPLSEDALEQLEAAQDDDRPPAEKWKTA